MALNSSAAVAFFCDCSIGRCKSQGIKQSEVNRMEKAKEKSPLSVGIEQKMGLHLLLKQHRLLTLYFLGIFLKLLFPVAVENEPRRQNRYRQTTPEERNIMCQHTQ